jgi:thiamine-phosphate pyrophosphorylase
VSAPTLLAISDRRALPHGWTLERWAASLQAAGVPALQLREKDLPDRAQLALLRLLRGAFAGTLLVNGRADLAVAAGADGVHLPADGVPTAPLRARFPRLCIGRSTHTLAEVEREAMAGADYVTFGPVLASPGKGEPIGLAALARAASVGIPVIALGGIGPADLDAVARAGAAGAAGIRAFHDVDGLGDLVAAAQAAFAAPAGSHPAGPAGTS